MGGVVPPNRRQVAKKYFFFRTEFPPNNTKTIGMSSETPVHTPNTVSVVSAEAPIEDTAGFAAKCKRSHRNWLLTTFHDLEALETHISGLPVTYYVCGEETCPKSGKKHKHLYLHLSRAVTFAFLYRHFQVHTPHLLYVQCPEGAEKYCKKDGMFTEFGVKPTQGKRTDIERVTEMLEGGASMRQVAMTEPDTFIKYSRSFQTYAQLKLCEQERHQRSAVFWYYGKAGTGKTYAVRKLYAPGELYVKMPGNKWYDGYMQQEAVLLDDFDPSDANSFWGSVEGFRHFLLLLDDGPMQVEVKGSMLNFFSKAIFITSEYSPQEAFARFAQSHGDAKNKIDQIVSRIGVVQEFTTPFIGMRRADATSVSTNYLESRKRKRFIELMGEPPASLPIHETPAHVAPTETVSNTLLPFPDLLAHLPPPLFTNHVPELNAFDVTDLGSTDIATDVREDGSFDVLKMLESVIDE